MRNTRSRRRRSIARAILRQAGRGEDSSAAEVYFRNNYGFRRSNERHFGVTRRRRKIDLKQIKLQVHFRRKCAYDRGARIVQMKPTDKQTNKQTKNYISFDCDDGTEYAGRNGSMVQVAHGPL